MSAYHAKANQSNKGKTDTLPESWIKVNKIILED